LGSSGVRVAHFVVDAFTAVTAVGGGTAWATGLESDRFPAEMLRRTQFGSYVIPGLILADCSRSVVGPAVLREHAQP
jgi:hypothetical protein